MPCPCAGVPVQMHTVHRSPIPFHGCCFPHWRGGRSGGCSSGAVLQRCVKLLLCVCSLCCCVMQPCPNETALVFTNQIAVPAANSMFSTLGNSFLTDRGILLSIPGTLFDDNSTTASSCRMSHNPALRDTMPRRPYMSYTNPAIALRRGVVSGCRLSAVRAATRALESADWAGCCQVDIY